MKLSYRNQHNAEATAKFWNKPLDRPDWYKIEAQGDDEAEILIYDVIGWPFNDAGEFVRNLNAIKAKIIIGPDKLARRGRLSTEPPSSTPSKTIPQR